MAEVVCVERHDIDSVTLKINRTELQYLCTVLERTGGSPERSLRGAAQSIIDALWKMNIDVSAHARHNQVEKYDKGSHSIYFMDTK